LCKGGITRGMRYCTAGLTPVAGSTPGCPKASSAPIPALLFQRGKGKERTWQLLKDLPTALARASEQQEQAESGPKQNPWSGPRPDLPLDRSSPFSPSLLFHLQGIRIPTLGSLSVVPTQTQVGNKIEIIQRPVFCLARNLAVVHKVMNNKDDLPGKTAD